MANEIYGTVQWIVFSVEERHFCVFRMEERETGQLITVAGNIETPYKGEIVKLRGWWKRHPRFGMQFQAESKEMIPPKKEEDMIRFLSSGLISGIGSAMAERIVETFGKDTTDILSNHIDALLEVPGIGKKTLEKIKSSYAVVQDIQNIILVLQSADVPDIYAAEIQKAYGKQAMTVVETDPYRMVREIKGLTFKQVDRLALQTGTNATDTERIVCGIRQILVNAAREGHVCLPEKAAYLGAAELLSLPLETVSEIGKKTIQSEEIPSIFYGEETYLYLPHLYEAETESVYRIHDFMNTVPQQSVTLAIEKFEQKNGIILAREQKAAVAAAVNQGLLIITGGPGTGKTTLVQAVLAAAEQCGLSVRLLAPTGRAAKRLGIACRQNADTIHKALEAELHMNGKTLFSKNESDPLAEDIIIVDEASMIDISLFYRLSCAIKEKGRLILVGDIDQLPPVGPGSPLRDLIQWGKAPTIRLHHVFRQKEGSGIIENATRIRDGLSCIPDEKGEFEIDFVDSEEAAYQLVLNLCQNEHYGEEEIKLTMQVLSPMYRGRCGVDQLNLALQREFQKINMESARFLRGDKVMQVRNDYEKGIYNGDIGIIWAVEKNKLFVRFSEKELVYEGEEKQNLQMAYATTVHKSQGSEYDTVIMVLLPTQYNMLQRNLLYTGITRAKKKTVLITTENALNHAIEMNRLSTRHSLFLPLLKRCIS